MTEFPIKMLDLNLFLYVVLGFYIGVFASDKMKLKFKFDPNQLETRLLMLVRQLYHYIMKPIKHRGRVTPVGKFGELGNNLEQVLTWGCWIRKCPLV